MSKRTHGPLDARIFMTLWTRWKRDSVNKLHADYLMPEHIKHFIKVSALACCCRMGLDAAVLRKPLECLASTAFLVPVLHALLFFLLPASRASFGMCVLCRIILELWWECTSACHCSRT